MKYLALFLFLLPALLVGQSRKTALSADTLKPGVVRWSAPIQLTDTTSTLKPLVYSLGGGITSPITQNFRVVARVLKDGVYSDTLAIDTLTASANLSKSCPSKTSKQLIDGWIPTLSGTDSTAVWALRQSGGAQVQFGLVPYSNHVGGQKLVLLLEIR